MLRRLFFSATLSLFAAAAVAQTDDLLVGTASTFSGNAPWWVKRVQGVPATVDIDFADGRYFQVGQPAGAALSQLLTVTRAQTGSYTTNLLPTAAIGFPYATFAANIPRLLPGAGLISEEARTNLLLNSTTPVTQTTASLGIGTYTLWVNGSGTATPSAGTATISGASAASNGAPNTFTVSVAGTVVITVVGSLNAFQLELGTFGTSLIVTAGATQARAADVMKLTNLPSFGPSYTIYASGTPEAPTSYATSQFMLAITTASGTDRIQIARTGGGSFAAFMRVGGTNTYIQQPATWSQNTFGKIALSVTANAQNAAYNGIAMTAGSQAAIPAAPTEIDIGGLLAASFFNGPVSRVTIFAANAFPTPALQSLTQGSAP